MFNLKSFVKDYEVGKITINGITEPIIQTKTPCVLIPADQLYRLIHGNGVNFSVMRARLVTKINRTENNDELNAVLDDHMMSREIDWYCKNELEDATFLTGAYTPTPDDCTSACTDKDE